MKIQRDLKPFPLGEAMAALLGGVPGTLVVAMSEGQWDGLLACAGYVRSLSGGSESTIFMLSTLTRTTRLRRSMM